MTEHDINPEPARLEWLDGRSTVRITWQDGAVGTYPIEYLRQICPCAVCRESHAAPPLSAKPPKRFQVLSEQQVRVAREGLSVVKVYPVGRYALGFEWSDGHSEGIYSFRYLREHAPPPERAG